MAKWLRQSTVVTAKIGPFVDNADGYTAETGLTITQADVRLSKNGAAFAQKTEATSCTHDENGWYGCPLDATDTGTLGRLQLAVNESGALPVWHEFMVVPANVWDSLFGSDKLQVHMAEITDALITAAAIATDAIGAAELAADAVTEIWDHSTRTLTQSAASVTSAVAGSTITGRRGDTLSVSLTGLGSLAGRSKLWFTVKRDDDDIDSESLIQVEETAGLLYFNGGAATAGNATLVVDDEDAGNVTITVVASDMADLGQIDDAKYDLQMLVSTTISTVTSGVFNLELDQTRAVS